MIPIPKRPSFIHRPIEVDNLSYWSKFEKHVEETPVDSVCQWTQNDSSIVKRRIDKLEPSSQKSIAFLGDTTWVE